MSADGNVWICMDCSARGAAPGNCASCGEGPLLDLRDAQVRAALAMQDREGALKRSRRLLGVASGIAAVVGIPLIFTPAPFDFVFGRGHSLVWQTGIGTVILIAAAVYALLRALFPYRRRFEGIE